VDAVRVLGVPLAPLPFDTAIQALLDAAHKHRRLRGHFCTVHTAVEATENPALLGALQSADLVCTDGMPLVWICRLRGARDVERVAGPDVMLVLCDKGRPLGLRHYFLGGGPGTPETLAARMTSRFKGLQVAGTHSPPFGNIAPDEDTRIIAAINASRPDIVWVGLGTPKQDVWAADHAAVLAAPVILAVGAAFDFHSGRLRRAPRWMRQAGFEWLFRLLMEPRRLWRRYLTTNARFGWLLLREEVARWRDSSSGRPA
jgi:N-acetylglucosaminyldiphosphoundecaprenol N-acetyl-beta-D-mannosaminyltransferase